MLNSTLSDAIDRQRPGWSLEQEFYTSPEIFEFERRGWLAKQWHVLGHCSEVPEPGSYVVRELLGESLIIVRGKDKVVRGFYNVCRHRGSRICDRDGKAANLTCPYHAWSYRLDGSLRAAPAMSETIDLTQRRLHAIPVREIGGFILGSLKQGAEPKQIENAERVLNHQGIPQARIAARRSYPTAANWKLVVENFEECYHCLPAHPELCTVTGMTKMATAPTAEEKETMDRWLREEADPNAPVEWESSSRNYEADVFFVRREVLGGGRKTSSQDGKPVAPLMGKVPRFDGGSLGLAMRPFFNLDLLNDHAVVFQFVPRTAESTDVIVTWLVAGSAKESEVDIERMTWLWDTTILQDKKIVENNARGVRSLAYGPGPYSTIERSATGFVEKYLQGLRADCNGRPVRPFTSEPPHPERTNI